MGARHAQHDLISFPAHRLLSGFATSSSFKRRRINVTSISGAIEWRYCRVGFILNASMLSSASVKTHLPRRRRRILSLLAVGMSASSRTLRSVVVLFFTSPYRLLIDAHSRFASPRSPLRDAAGGCRRRRSLAGVAGRYQRIIATGRISDACYHSVSVRDDSITFPRRSRSGLAALSRPDRSTAILFKRMPRSSLPAQARPSFTPCR